MIKFLFRLLILIIIILATLYITHKDVIVKKVKHISKATYKFIDKKL